MSLFRLALDGLRHHWRIHLTVAAGVAAATAVVTGALLIGDSVQGTLRHLTLDRLGQIDDVLVAPHFFRSQLAANIRTHATVQQDFPLALPVVFLEGSLANPADAHRAQVGRVTVLGSSDGFWTLGSGGPQRAPGEGQVVLNEPLALDLGVKSGDEVILRIGRAGQIPPDSALGRKTDTVRSRRLVVSEVIPAVGLARFGLRPTQLSRYNAFTSTRTLQALVDQPDKVNAVLVAGPSTETTPSAAADAALVRSLQPTLEDYGFSLVRSRLGYVQFSSERMLIEPVAVDVVEKALHEFQPQSVFTYLANTIAVNDRQIPYSTIAALDFRVQPPLGPFKTPEGDVIPPLAGDEIVLNSWAADDLEAKVGDTVDVTFFEPESTHGKIVDRTVSLRLRAIADLSGAAADPDLTPELKGVTDQKSIANWNPPFPFDARRIRKKDEKYWDEHRATPKAFVSLATGRRLWSSRFGDTTAIRIAPPPDLSLEDLARRLKFDPAALGFQFLPVKRMGLAASAGTTPFNWLFLGLSFFIVAAAVMLISLLFRLGVERRAAEIGILAAVGLRRRQIACVLAGEGLLVAAAGGLAGLAIGVGYAWLMLVGLRTWWSAAVNTPALRLYARPVSFIEGYACGVVVSVLTILWALRRLRRATVRRLLSGQPGEDTAATRRRSWAYFWALGASIGAIVLGFSATRLSGEEQAGSFVGSGALALIACLAALLARLRSGDGKSLVTAGEFPLARLALRNGARNPTRSTLTVGLIGAASFLIVAMSAFRLDPSAEGIGLHSGSGGFDLIAESDQPVYQDVNSKEGREDFSFSTAAAKTLAACTTISLRLQPGDDASCLNLYQPAQPRVLGVPDTLIERDGFAWASSAAVTPEEKANPWLLLEKSPNPAATGGSLNQIRNSPSIMNPTVVPVVMDENTAVYSLHLDGIGDTLEMRDGRGETMRLLLVGLLKNSIFQGDVLMSEANCLRYFPSVSGYRVFLIDTKREPVKDVRRILTDNLADYGFDAQRTLDLLASFFEVQNTYLSTFQSLGALGLLLGTFGLATVQLRSVLERRAELALLRAAGFRRRRLARLVMLENALLLLGGLGVGVAAALIAVLPHWFTGGASVPWGPLAATLALVLIVGLAAGRIAVRAVTRADLIPALRGE